MANELSTLAPNEGSTRVRTRVGRGEGSGLGKTSGRGQKGAKSRSGYKNRAGFEGGQMPLHRRLPKRGFHNPFSLEYAVIGLDRLADLAAGSVVTEDTLRAAGIVKPGADGVKILGGSSLAIALHVRVAKLSGSAAAAILAAGGTTEGPLPE
jgi:large subunit ribosomal protein L15